LGLTLSKKLVEKYAVKSADEMVKEQEDLQREVAEASTEMEQELEAFSTKTDELKNPNNSKLLAIIKRPTTSQFKRFTPISLLKYRDKPEDIPPDVAMKYTDDMYQLMAELVVQPKHTAEWWEDNTGDEFMALFQAHLAKTREKMSKTIEDFLSPTSATKS